MMINTDAFEAGAEKVGREIDQKVTGIKSGFPRLDSLTGGWQDSDLIVVGGRPTMGKSPLVCRFAESAALLNEPPAPVGMFSLERSAKKVATSMIEARAQVSLSQYKEGDSISTEEKETFSQAIETLSTSPIYIDDEPELTIEELREKAEGMQEKWGIDLIVVDHLQMIKAQSSNLASGATRSDILGHVTEGLKVLGRKLAVPVIVTCQLNRDVENRGGDKRPILTDLRGSGRIEQVADVIAFVYRAERYGIAVDERGNSTEGIAEIILEKQRGGPIGTVETKFDKRHGRFYPLGGGEKCGSNPKGESSGAFEDDAPF